MTTPCNLEHSEAFTYMERYQHNSIAADPFVPTHYTHHDGQLDRNMYDYILRRQRI
jgi:hypothetical protein